MILKGVTAFAAALLLVACAVLGPPPKPQPSGHLDNTAQAVPAPAPAIPTVIPTAPLLPPPAAASTDERYTVVVNEVPVRELLFALARDAKLNIDIGGEISGPVTLNAIDQTLPQILERIARQVDLSYEIVGDTIRVAPDEPYLHTYEVGYVNLARDVDTTVNVATRVATTGKTSVADDSSSGGSGGRDDNNASSTRLQSRSYNRFWNTLRVNVLSILGEPATAGGQDQASDKVIANAEAGLLTVRAKRRQHELIADFIARVLTNARRQVLIEATIVEVSLNDQYQAGVDWNLLLRRGGSGFTVGQDLLGAVTDGAIDEAISTFTLGYTDPTVGDNSVTSTVRLLREFGDTRVLSSPRLMVLNNQTAVLKVVEELVYFTLEVTDKDASTLSEGRTFVETEVHSVPVGLVMAVTPQISANHEVTLTVRPTTSQKIDDAIDPGPQLAASLRGEDQAEITNLVPVIRVREMESVLKLVDGQIGVLGGLMQDELRQGDREVPGLAKVPVLGDLFFHTRESVARKTELVVFLRPVVVRTASVGADLRDYARLLPAAAATGSAP